MQTRTIYHSISFFALALVTVSLKSVATDGFVVLSLCLVMTVGLSHGALDYLKGHAVLKTYAEPPLSYFYLVYIAFGCGILLAWYMSPALLIATFLLVAAYHFGKEDASFASRNSKGVHNLLYVLKGGVVIAAPMAFRPLQTEEIFSALNVSALNTIDQEVFVYLLACSFVAHVCLGARCLRTSTVLVADFIAICVLNWSLHPLVAFSLYFCFLHSIRHSLDIIGEMEGRTTVRVMRFVRQALPLTLITGVVFTLVLFLLMSRFSLDVSANKVIFLGLAALTFPHVALEYLFESRVVGGHDRAQLNVEPSILHPPRAAKVSE
ncbi:MAG: Brp/Blh family beta-carotene 15,15'-dioxygenase [Bradymonadia bacterium]